IVRLGSNKTNLVLVDIAVVVRHPDGSLTIERHPFPAAGNILGMATVGFIAGLVVAAPLPGAAVGALFGAAGSALASAVGISNEFIRDVELLIKPGTSALFVLDDVGDMEVILHAIRGLGGTVLKTNVDVEQAKLIQQTLAAGRDPTD